MKGKFKYRGKAEIKHLNTRKEGEDENKILAVDVKFQTKCASNMWNFFDDDIATVLYTDVGAVKNKRMGAIDFDNEINNCELVLFGERRFPGCTVKKFSLKPADTHQALLTFSVTIQPTKDEVAILAECLMDEIDIEVLPQPELDFGPGGGPSLDDLNRRLQQSMAEHSAVTTGALGQAMNDAEDQLYTEAVKIVLQVKRGEAVSISSVQRKLRIGYNRAARLLEAMEQAGVISAMDATGTRKLLVTGGDGQ